jgi:3-oxoacyl-[acyl-carrier protein] reductase
MTMSDSRLADRVALITGVSRRQGIGFAIARRLLAEGGTAFVHSWTPHDTEMPWGVDSAGIDGVLDALGHPDRRAHLAVDLLDPAGPRRTVDAAVEAFGPLNTLVVNHARSSQQSLEMLTADELDTSWAVNVRATLLLVQAFAEQYAGGDDGRVVLFTSGQHRAPMADEVPYAVSKGAIHQMTGSLAEALIDRGITVNCVNPGPTDTGWASADTEAVVRAAMPRKRWNTPEEAAAVVTWLLSPDSASVTGQVIDAEGGFRRHRLGR